MAAATPEARWGLRLSNTTTSPACNAGTSTWSTYDWNAAVSVDPGNASGARTPSNPSAAITVTDSHEPGAEATARAPRGAQAEAGVIAVVTPVSSTRTSRSDAIR